MSCRIPHVTISQLLKVGLSAVVLRCLEQRCRGEAVVGLGSFPVQLHEFEQQRIDWGCIHCGRGQVVVEQLLRRHRRFKTLTLDEMRQAVMEAKVAFLPAHPIGPSGVRRTLISKHPISREDIGARTTPRPRNADTFPVHRERFQDA